MHHEIEYECGCIGVAKNENRAADGRPKHVASGLVSPRRTRAEEILVNIGTRLPGRTV